jgi:hypothetical protein
VAATICPLCRQRKARRACPALGHSICAVCCGTKRRVEIDCPAGCAYLASAREHPAAVVVRQQQHDIARIVQAMRDLTERQSQLFLAVSAFIAGYRPPELQPIVDADVAEAAGALASTLETASRGVIYEHRPGSAPAGRLLAAMRPWLAELGGRSGSAFEQDAAIVLRRIGQVAKEAGAWNLGGRAYLDLLARMQSTIGEAREPDRADAPRLIVP